MARKPEVRRGGMGIGARFTLSMSIALALVMAIAGLLLYFSSTKVSQRILEESFVDAVRISSKAPEFELRSEQMRKLKNVEIMDVTLEDQQRATLYRAVTLDESGRRVNTDVLLPAGGRSMGKSLLGLILPILVVVVLVGAGVAMWVARRVTDPIGRLVDDVRKIASGDLQHRIRVSEAGEVGLLARAIERMTGELEEAQEAELELSVRNREMELAGGVHEALLPVATPMVAGYDLGAAHLSSGQIGGDLHDYVEHDNGRIGLLVLEVSGQGVPAALIGATARSYLRSELRQATSAAAALSAVNRELARDVRRGMYVTALYVHVDPLGHRASIASAGHKAPLLRLTAADGKLRAIHPEGIALGFDRGPVFDQRLEVQELELAPRRSLDPHEYGAARGAERGGAGAGREGLLQARPPPHEAPHDQAPQGAAPSTRGVRGRGRPAARRLAGYDCA